MTLFCAHPDASHEQASKNRFLTAGARQLCSALRVIHGAIIAGKMRRLRSELIFHQPVQDATKLPQIPLILGDRWDT
jgi:hypothetical protein